MCFCFCLIINFILNQFFCATVLHNTKLFMGEGSGLKNVHEKFNQNIYEKKMNLLRLIQWNSGDSY